MKNVSSFSPFVTGRKICKIIHTLENPFPHLQNVGAHGERNLASSLTEGPILPHQVLITSLEKEVLSCWRGLLLPFSEDPGPAQEASRLQELLQECGWKYPDPTLLKVS